LQAPGTPQRTAPHAPSGRPGGGPWSAARPRCRAGRAARAPAACPRGPQRWGARWDAPGGPRGTSPQRQPVRHTESPVWRSVRNEAWGIPRPRACGAGGKRSAHKRHAQALTPSKRPAILPPSVWPEQYRQESYEWDRFLGFYEKVKSALCEKIEQGGYAISFGWNTNGFGKARGFDIIEIMTVAHGGSKNDTVVTVEVKR